MMTSQSFKNCHNHPMFVVSFIKCINNKCNFDIYTSFDISKTLMQLNCINYEAIHI